MEIRLMPLTPSQRQARMRAKRKRYEEALEMIVKAHDEWDAEFEHSRAVMVTMARIARAALTPDKETQG